MVLYEGRQCINENKGISRQKSVRSPWQINYSKEYWSVKVLFAFNGLVWLIRMGVCLFAQN